MIEQSVLRGNGLFTHPRGLRRLLTLDGLNQLVELMRWGELAEGGMGLEAGDSGYV